MTAFAGFDSSAYPGDVIMKWLRANTNLVWCGYYFGKTPSHTGTGWMGKRAVLQGLNWGIAPLCVGQELIGPGSHHTTGIQGASDGKDAANFMTSEGFAPGSVVYLDLENGLPFPDAQKDYVKNWCSTVQQAGLTPGVYCSHTLRRRSVLSCRLPWCGPSRCRPPIQTECQGRTIRIQVQLAQAIREHSFGSWASTA
jgi:Domain of unknown function (DUF1906)